MLIRQALHPEDTVMEHRWGERLATDLAVCVIRGANAPLSARLRNMSITGGYLQSAAPLLPLAAVELQLQVSGRRVRLRGWVVRSDKQGYGMEWDLACRGIERVLVAARSFAPIDAPGHPGHPLPYCETVPARHIQ